MRWRSRFFSREAVPNSRDVATRRRGCVLEDFLRGIAYANMLFGLQIPSPAKDFDWGNLREADVDLFFEHLLAAIFDARCNPGEACRVLVEKFDQLFGIPP